MCVYRVKMIKEHKVKRKTEDKADTYNCEIALRGKGECLPWAHFSIIRSMQRYPG